MVLANIISQINYSFLNQTREQGKGSTYTLDSAMEYNNYLI